MTNNTPLQFALVTAMSLFTVVNPLSAAPLFVSMTGELDDKQRKRVAKKACLAALIVLLIFGGAGTMLFRFLGITTQAFQITGGILFVIMSIRALLGGPRELDERDAEAVDPSIVPIAIPILSGPGAITTIVVLSGQSGTIPGKAILALVLLMTMMVTYAILRSAPRIVGLLGSEGRRATDKILALLTGVIGVQFVLNGVTPLAVAILKTAEH